MTGAVAVGVVLALLYMRGTRVPSAVAIAHGLAGACGAALLIAALQGPRRGDAMGTGSFGTMSAVLIGVALAFGLLVPVLHRRSARAADIVIATHASLAIAGFVLLLAWASL